MDFAVRRRLSPECPLQTAHTPTFAGRQANGALLLMIQVRRGAYGLATKSVFRLSKREDDRIDSPYGNRGRGKEAA